MASSEVIIKEITPCLGIGDILLIKMACVNNKINIKKFNLSLPLLKEYRLHPEQYGIFITQLIKCLFGDISILNCNSPVKPFPVEKYTIKKPYIYDHYGFISECRNSLSRVCGGKYIILHTKIRLEMALMDNFNKNCLPLLVKFFEELKTTKTIVIMGEKTVEPCLEQKLLGITSLYDVFMRGQGKNKIIDMTKETLYSGNPDYSDFENDLRIINGADINVVFGIGGALNLCQAFSHKTLCFSGVLTIYKWILGVYDGMYVDFGEFFKILKGIF